MQLDSDTMLADKYVLRARVGRGPIGEVWAAANTLIRKWVAVEILNPDVHRDERMFERLRQAVLIPAEIEEPGLREIFDVDEDPRIGPFVVMELLDGVSVEGLLADRGVLSPAHAAWVVAQTASIVDRLHARGLTHGNLSASQVFVESASSPNDEPKIRLLAPGLSRFAASSTLRTVVDPTWGHPTSMAPEQLDGGEETPAADAWALGSLLFQLLIGHPPFARNTPVATIRAISRAESPSLPPGAPGPIKRAILDSLNRDPEARPSARQLRSVLSPFTAPPPRAWIEAYRLGLGPAPGRSGGDGAASTPIGISASTSLGTDFTVDLEAERDEEIGTAPTLLADRGTPDAE